MVEEKTNEQLEPDARLAEEGLLGWLRLKFGSGLALLKKERTWAQIDQAISYVEGKHTTPKTKTISTVVDNRLRKIALETVAVMTDVRPIWNFETYVEAYKKQGDILNKLSRAWWRNTKADRRLGSALLYAACGGSGYALLTWNKDLNDGDGDLELVPFDPRDVIPIDPAFSETIQDWRGVILRQRLPIETVKRMYPSKAGGVVGKETTWAPVASPDHGKLEEITGSPLWDLVEGTGQRHHLPPGVDLMRAYIKDDSLNLTDKPIKMGEGEWSYDVYPLGAIKPDGRASTREDARLYPRGRLVIFTPECILKDIPNPHWHGKFPVVRFQLDPLPWTLLGCSMIGDLIPMQDTLNEALRGTEDGLAQWVKRAVAADKRSMPKSALNALDSRAAGPKIHFNAATGEPFKFIDGPDPQVFKVYQEIIQMLKEEMDDISGMRGVQNLAQLGQMPSADTMERFMEAMSPVLRLRSRAMEISLTELAEMLKVGFFQWYTTKRRVELLGMDGVSREDFNYQPGDMLPEGDGDRQHRAMKHHKLFSFQVSPNSWLNVSHSQQKMFMLQLLRANLMDPWTIWDQFDVPDAGPMPAETVPERIVRARELGLLQGPTPEIVQAQQQAQLLQSLMMAMQIQQMMQQGPQGAAPPGQMPGKGGGPKPPGAGGKTPGVGAPVGRPPSGQVPPHFEMKDQGTRPVVSESK